MNRPAPAAPVDLFVPGRLCLFGEHSDWAGAYRARGLSVAPGACLIAGTDQGLFARAEPLAGLFEVRSPAPDGTPGEPACYPAEPAALRQVAAAGGFDAYAAGVAALALEEHGAGGLRLDIHRRTLPLKKGLSSSAAVSVLTARAFSRVHGLALSIEAEMDLAYRGELLTGSACGRMDQACAYGRTPVLLGFDGDRMIVERLAPGARFDLLIVDLAGAKDTRRILADLNAVFARGEGDLGRRLRRALGEANLATLAAARRALEAGDAPALGALMTAAQAVFDRDVAPASPRELAAPRLRAVLAHPAAAELAWGGKGVGSQGDGTAQFVCRGPAERAALGEILTRDCGASWLPLAMGEIP